jgi:hypothetical protein
MPCQALNLAGHELMADIVNISFLLLYITQDSSNLQTGQHL